MSFAKWGYGVVSASLMVVPLVSGCGDDDEAPAGGADAAAGEGGVGGSGGATPQGGSAGRGGGGPSGGAGAQAGTGGTPGGGAGGTVADGGPSCSLACVRGTCVVSGGTESCECESSYSGALCDTIDAPPATGIAFWLDADDDATTGGGAAGPLTRWLDKGAAGLVALAGPAPPDAGADAGDASADASVPPPPPVVDAGDAGDAEAGLGDDVPALVVNASLGRRTVRFDGNDCMRLHGFSALTSQDAYDVFLVVGASGGAQSVLSAYAAAGHGLRVETTATSMRFLHRMPFGSSGGDNLVGTEAFSRSGLDVATLWRTATEQSLRRAGATAESIGASASAFDQDLTLAIGCLDVDAPSRYLVGDVAEILVYQGGLSEVDRTAVEDYLSRKWLGRPL